MRARSAWARSLFACLVRTFGLGHGDIRTGGLLVRQPGTVEFRHGIGKLRGGAGGAGLRGVVGQGHYRLRGMQLALRLQ